MRISKKKMDVKRKSSAHINVKPKTPRHPHPHHHSKQQIDKQKMKEISRRMFLMNDVVLANAGSLDLFSAIEAGSLETVKRLLESSELPLDVNR